MIGVNRWLAKQSLNDLARGRIAVPMLCQVAQMISLVIWNASS